MCKENRNTDKQCTIQNVIVRLLPMTWFVWYMYKIGRLKKDYDGGYRGDPENFYISRWIFRYTPITGKTPKNTKFLGNWYWKKFLLWEVMILIKTKKNNKKTKKSKVKFP